MSRRALPSFLGAGAPAAPSSGPGRPPFRSMSAPSPAPAPDPAMPSLAFGGDVFYVGSEEESDLAVEALRSYLEALPEGLRALGLDLEWPVLYREGPVATALLQLATVRQAYLFHLAAIGGLPASLRALLGDERVAKVGLAVGGDCQRLHREFGAVVRGEVELDEMARPRLAAELAGRRWSLAELCERVLGRRLEKPPALRLSRWDLALSRVQMVYAATDAYAGVLLWLRLLEMPLRADAERAAAAALGARVLGRRPQADPALFVPAAEQLQPLPAAAAALYRQVVELGVDLPRAAAAAGISAEAAEDAVRLAVSSGRPYWWDELGVPQAEQDAVVAAMKAVAAGNAPSAETAAATPLPPAPAGPDKALPGALSSLHLVRFPAKEVRALAGLDAVSLQRVLLIVSHALRAGLVRADG